MPGHSSIEGYAIVSADGMLADHDGHMPAALKVDADHRFFEEGLNGTHLVVHGRHSHEQQPGSDRRRRLVLSRGIATIADHPSLPNASLWNPAGLSFVEACAAIDFAGGTVAVIGGTEVFGLFLDIGFDAFHLSRVADVRFPGGRPVFPRVPCVTPEQVLTGHGLAPGRVRILDVRTGTSLVTWRAPSSAHAIPS